MKILLFTHAEDIDGAGCAILMKYAFPNVTIVPTKTFLITKNVEEAITSGYINNFDFVMVTDLCIKEPLLSIINNDINLKNKITVIDHHKTEIEEGNNKYDFVNITVEKDGKKASGTSLVYDYLQVHKFIQPTKFLDTLVEYTREYDVWDWVKYQNKEARYLHILFETIGFDKYLNLITNKLSGNKTLEFDNEDMEIIKNFEEKIEEDINNALANIKIITLNINDINYKIGYIKCLYRYRNDVNEFIKENNIYDIDAVGMIMLDRDTVSYRTVKNIDVSKIAVYFGGKGHVNASSNPQDNQLFKELVLSQISQSLIKERKVVTYE